MKYFLLNALVESSLTLHLLPDDWGNSTVWLDNTYCTEETDNFLIFDVTEDQESVLASREGCLQFCLDNME